LSSNSRGSGAGIEQLQGGIDLVPKAFRDHSQSTDVGVVSDLPFRYTMFPKEEGNLSLENTDRGAMYSERQVRAATRDLDRIFPGSFEYLQAGTSRVFPTDDWPAGTSSVISAPARNNSISRPCATRTVRGTECASPESRPATRTAESRAPWKRLCGVFTRYIAPLPTLPCLRSLPTDLYWRFLARRVFCGGGGSSSRCSRYKTAWTQVLTSSLIYVLGVSRGT